MTIDAQTMKHLHRCNKCGQPLPDEWKRTRPQARYHDDCRPSKYGSRKTAGEWMGQAVTFDSKKEAKRAGELQLLQQQGLIFGLRRQCPVRCMVNDKLVCTYYADFVYFEGPPRPLRDDFEGTHPLNPKEIIEDVKSTPTRRTSYYRLKKRLLEASTGLTIREV